MFRQDVSQRYVDWKKNETLSGVCESKLLKFLQTLPPWVIKRSASKIHDILRPVSVFE